MSQRWWIDIYNCYLYGDCVTTKAIGTASARWKGIAEAEV